MNQTVNISHIEGEIQKKESLIKRLNAIYMEACYEILETPWIEYQESDIDKLKEETFRKCVEIMFFWVQNEAFNSNYSHEAKSISAYKPHWFAHKPLTNKKKLLERLIQKANLKDKEILLKNLLLEGHEEDVIIDFISQNFCKESLANIL